jgi:DNA-binding HxlR family transcriptional regulator
MVTCRTKTPGCAHLSDGQETTLREIVGQVAGKWPLWTLHALHQADEPLRFSRLLERVDGIIQKMLTQTLRGLERDGLVTRTIFPEVPPRVEYALTEIGRKTMEQFTPFWIWIVGQLPGIEAARARFEGQHLNIK